METIKTTLNIASENLLKDVERFSAKWEQAKPRPSSGQLMSEDFKNLQNHLENIKEKKNQWQDLMEQKNKLMSDYEKFGIQTSDFSLCEEIEEDLKKQEKLWGVFQEFSEG